MCLNKIKFITFITSLSLTFFMTSQKVVAFSKFYTEDNHGLHLKIIGKTKSGNSWILREYYPKDIEDHWSIISKNTDENKLYPSVSAGTKESVFKKGVTNLLYDFLTEPLGAL